MSGDMRLPRAVQDVATGLRKYRPELRPGQAAYNALHFLDPAMAAELHSSDADPFYDDTKLPAFWAALDQVDAP